MNRFQVFLTLTLCLLSFLSHAQMPDAQKEKFAQLVYAEAERRIKVEGNIRTFDEVTSQLLLEVYSENLMKIGRKTLNPDHIPNKNDGGLVLVYLEILRSNLSENKYYHSRIYFARGAMAAIQFYDAIGMKDLATSLYREAYPIAYSLTIDSTTRKFFVELESVYR